MTPARLSALHSLRLERDSNAEIEKACRTVSRDGKLIRVQSGRVTLRGGRKMQLAEAGTPDRFWLPGDGLLVMLEQKGPDGVLSAEQMRWHDWAERNGYHVATVESGADVVRVVNEIRRKG